MIFKVLVKTIYGRTVYYPVNETACIFSDLIRKKTFSVKELNLIESLGYTIEKQFYECVAMN